LFGKGSEVFKDFLEEFCIVAARGFEDELPWGCSLMQ
jgi:hypothetical protein